MNLHFGEKKSGVKRRMMKNSGDDSRNGCVPTLLTVLDSVCQFALKDVLYRP
jgi:hypothetical protein